MYGGISWRITQRINCGIPGGILNIFLWIKSGEIFRASVGVNEF